MTWRALGWVPLAGLCAATWVLASLAPGHAFLGSPNFREVGTEAPHATAPIGAARRIASASLLTDELLLELVPMERIVAVSYVVDWPSVTPVAGRLPARILRTRGEPEQLLAARPDLVLLSDYNNAPVEAFLRASRTPFRRIAAPRHFGELFATTRTLAAIVGRERHGEALVRRWTERLRALRPESDRVRGSRVLLLQGQHGYAKGTLQSDCLSWSGLTNALDGLSLTGTPTLHGELVLYLQPDVVFVAAATPRARRATSGDLPPEVPWHLVPAHAAGRIYVVPNANMASITHHAIDACEAYAHLAGGLAHDS